MAREISVTSPFEKTDTIIKELKGIDGIMQLQVFRAVSIDPPGDVIKLAVPNSSLQKTMRLLDKYDLGRENGISASTSEPDSFIPTKPSYSIERDINEGSWEEMEMTISNDSNTSINTMIIMLVSGSLATIGIANNSLHIVVGGMLVAPGFMPITRVALGLISRNKGWYYGSIDFIKGYFALILGAVLTAAVLKAINQDPLPGSTTYYLTDQKLVEYWTTVTASSILASAVASIAGALLLATKKSVFTSGVMIGLALVPTAAIIGMGFIEGDLNLAGRALARFALDVALVFGLSLVVFLWTRFYYHKRDMQLR
ncbi:DUF389 domain-containing protein [Cesiribacter sp. SM1]|uniref:DUF389 domain-containing protein n=1 Tax=Cesiribacter sp. SM1 TaxID=2861196 RepID=UPI001CD2A1E2|nr:DUF389 domain-containing protein [Cesiribacter sp. SM1]